MASFMRTGRFLLPLNKLNVSSITNKTLLLLVHHLSRTPDSLDDFASSDLFENFHFDPVRDLCLIFREKSLRRKREEDLKVLGRSLTTEIVESVLREMNCGWNSAFDFFLWAEKQEGYRHNCYTFNAMASILSRANQKSALVKLVKNIAGSHCSVTPGSLGFFIRLLGGVGMADEASFLFDHASVLHCVPSSYTYNCLLETLAKCKRCDSVEFRLKEMTDSGLEVDKFTLMAVLQAYCNCGRLSEAMGVLDRMCNDGYADERAFTVLILAYSKSGEVDKAFALIERMERMNSKLSEKTYYVLIHGFKQEMRFDKAFMLFNKMKELGFRTDVGLYSVVIDGLCESKEYRKAFDLYTEMKDSGVLPDKTIILKLIPASLLEGNLELVDRLLKDVKDLNLGNSTLFCNAALEALVASGEVEKAYSLLRAMIASALGKLDGVILENEKFLQLEKGELPNVSSFCIVMDGLCKNSKLDSALKLLRDMHRIGCKGSLLIYNNLIHKLCNTDRLDEAYQILKDMKDSGFEPNHFTYNSIFGCLCQRENVSDALHLIKEMKQQGHQPWIKHCTLLVKKLCVGGRVMEACNFLNDMARSGVPPNLIAFSTAIHGLCKRRELDHALKLFHDISTGGCVPDVVSHNILIHGLCKGGRVPEAEALMNEVFEKGLLPSVASYNILIDGWFKNGRTDLALHWFSEMTSKARLPNVITYTTLIDGLLNAGQYEDGLAMWNEMEEKGCSPNRITYTALVHGLCKCGKADAALQYFHKMEEKDIDQEPFLFIELLNAYVLEGNFASALNVLRSMVEKQKCPAPDDKYFRILREILSELCEDDNFLSDIRNIIEEGHFQAISSIHDLAVDVKFDVNKE